MNVSEPLKWRRAAHAFRFKESFKSWHSSCIKVHNLKCSVGLQTGAGSGVWLGRECSAEVAADAELQNGNENFTSTDFTQSKVFILFLSKRQDRQQLYRKGKFYVSYDRCVSLEFGPQNRPYHMMFTGFCSLTACLSHMPCSSARAHTHTHARARARCTIVWGPAPLGQRTGISPSTRPNSHCEDNVFRHIAVTSCAYLRTRCTGVQWPRCHSNQVSLNWP
jgi:hypothetical protein